MARWPFCCLACLGHGAVAVVCDPEAAPREAHEFVSAARPAAAFVDEELRARWPLSSVPRRLGVVAARPPTRSVLDRLLIRTSAGRAASLAAYPAVLTGLDPAPPPVGVPDGDEAYVLFTSGSTGHPKGVCISRRSLLQHARTLAAVFGYGAATRLLVPLPTHHTDGLLSLVLPWLCGATALRPVGLTTAAAVDLLRAVRMEQATHLVVVPTLLSLLLDAAESTGAPPLGPPLQAVISTGAPLDERLWQTFEERFAVRVSNFYGMTETVTGGLFCGPSDDTYRRGTVGRPVDCEVRIIRPDGTVAPPDTAGELTVRGENLMLGYVGDPQATDAVLKDGWLRTGDIASQDVDGFVRIVGRAKSTVIFAGHNIQPEEVTRVLEGTAGVSEAVAFGVPHPTFGEILVASVVLRAGSGTGVSDLVSSCRESLAPYKVPRDIDLVDALPRGSAGKVSIPEVRETLSRASRRRPPCSFRGRRRDSGGGRRRWRLESRPRDGGARLPRLPRRPLAGGQPRSHPGMGLLRPPRVRDRSRGPFPHPPGDGGRARDPIAGRRTQDGP